MSAHQSQTANDNGIWHVQSGEFDRNVISACERRTCRLRLLSVMQEAPRNQIAGCYLGFQTSTRKSSVWILHVIHMYECATIIWPNLYMFIHGALNRPAWSPASKGWVRNAPCGNQFSSSEEAWACLYYCARVDIRIGPLPLACIDCGTCGSCLLLQRWITDSHSCAESIKKTLHNGDYSLWPQ